ncbi:MAG: ABC transporter substrate-binding protein [Gammaproteobacteria bacterium]|nr:ABC transporter substrate-binding protein [Gammaproteobacteria bacterium]
MATPGFLIPVHSALTTPLLVAGAPRQFSLMNGTLCAAVGLGLQSWLIVPICLVIQIIAIALTKKDPYFFQIMVRHIRLKTYYRV